MPLFFLLGCRPSSQEAPLDAPAVAEAACREIAVPALAGAAPELRAAQLRAVLIALDETPACLGAQLFRGPDSAAEQAVIIALMQADQSPLVRSRAAAALGGVRGDPRPAFAALYQARATEKDDAVASAQFASIADLLPSRAALQWEDGPTVAGLVALLGPGGMAAPASPEQIASSRTVMVQRARALTVLGDILEQAAVANKAHRNDNPAALAALASTTGHAAASSEIWNAWESTVLALLGNREHAGTDDADWRAPLLSGLAEALRNARLAARPRAELADMLIAWLDYPAGTVRVAALQAMDALVEVAAHPDGGAARDLAPLIDAATIARMHAALVKKVADPSPQVRAAAATVLGALAAHTGAGMEAVAPLLKDIDTQVRAAAEQALANHPGSAAGPAAVPGGAPPKSLP